MKTGHESDNPNRVLTRLLFEVIWLAKHGTKEIGKLSSQCHTGQKR